MNEGTIFAEYKFPSPWPLHGNIELLRKSSNGDEIKVLADTSGRLGVYINASEHKIENWFQPISIEGDGQCIICITWSSSEVSLFLNGNEVCLYENSEGKFHTLVSESADVKPETPIFGGIDVPANASDAEKFLLETILDIESKVISGSSYNLIKATGLLRQLFLDADPLMNVVNREHRVNITFETIDYNSQPPLTSKITIQDLDATSFPKAKKIESKLKEFLKAPCFMYEGITVSVRDVIKVCANVKGGVHFGKIKTDKEHAVLNCDRMISLLGKEPSHLLITGICKISLRAMVPLVDSIVNSNKNLS